MPDKNGSSNYDANNSTNNSQANGEKQARKEKLSVPWWPHCQVDWARMIKLKKKVNLIGTYYKMKFMDAVLWGNLHDKAGS